MEDHQLLRAKKLFLAAADLAATEREQYLDDQCGGDAVLRARVHALLTSDAATDDVLGELQVDGVTVRSFLEPDQPDDEIGDFRLIRELGRGGMGIVWLAEQKSLGRQVALKLIRPGSASEELLRRFRKEAEVLGQLQHPGIAQIYEVGTTQVGSVALPVEQPYFAMEYVSGIALDDYVMRNDLDTQQRLELLASICDSIDHAHRAGVVHRDLKPDNILVTDAGRPVLLDFGIARVTESDVMSISMHHTAGQIIGTLPYMSPEQVLGDQRRIDARSDVYSMGAVMFEVLSGRLPVDVQGRSIAEAARVICDEDPASLRSISAAFRGDVDTIVQKALEKDESRRYQSAAELAADIRRHLTDQPITARPATTLYQARKFVRRHTALVTVSALVFLALAAGTAGTSWGMLHARSQRQAALQESARARRVTQFLSDTLGFANPDVTDAPNITARTLVDRAAREVAVAFASDPTAEAEVRSVIGQTYAALGELDSSRQELVRALHLRTKVLDASLEAEYEVASPLYWVLQDLSNDTRYGIVAGRLQVVRQTLLQNHSAELVEAFRALARGAYATDNAEAEFASALARVEEFRLSRAPEDPQARRLFAEHLLVLGSQLSAVTILTPRDRLKRARGCEVLREALNWNGERVTHSSKVRTMDHLYLGLRSLGDKAEASQLAQSVLRDLSEQGLPEDHWFIALYRTRVAACLDLKDEAVNASLVEASLVGGYSVVRTASNGWTRHAAELKRYLVEHYQASGQLGAADRHQAEFADLLVGGTRSYDEMLAAFGPQQGALRAALLELAGDIRAQRAGAGLRHIQEACARIDLTDQDPRTALIARLLHAWSISILPPRSAAMQAYLLEIRTESVRLCRPHEARITWRLAQYLNMLARIQNEIGQHQEALQSASEAAGLKERLGENDYYYWAYQGSRGQALVGLDRCAEAIGVLLPNYDNLREDLGPLNNNCHHLLTFLIIACAQEDRHDELESRLHSWLDAVFERGDPGPLLDACWMITLVPGYAPELYRRALEAARLGGQDTSSFRAPTEGLGRALFRLGDYAGAIEAFRADEQETVGTLAFESMAHLKAGDRVQAERALRRQAELEGSLFARVQCLRKLYADEIERLR